MLCVGHPAAGLHLIRVQGPEFELFLVQWAAYIRGIVQLTGAIVVQYLSKYYGMPVEEVLVEHGIVVGKCFGEAR